MRFKDLTGQRFGRLTATKDSGSRRGNHVVWECVCDCGNITFVSSDRITSGKTQSCGCLKRERSSEAHRKHGGTGTRLHNIWNLMRRRCDNPQDELYGGRGITVCEEWRSFAAFRDWSISNGYSDDLSLDRINVNGDYEPGNCRWATDTQQQRNKRNNVFITFDGSTLTLAEWAEKTELPLPTLWNRLNTLSWSVERALTTPRKGGRSA